MLAVLLSMSGWRVHLPHTRTVCVGILRWTNFTQWCTREATTTLFLLRGRKQTAPGRLCRFLNPDFDIPVMHLRGTERCWNHSPVALTSVLQRREGGKLQMSGPLCKSQAVCLAAAWLRGKHGSMWVCKYTDTSALSPLLRILLSLALNICCLLLLFRSQTFSAILCPINQLWLETWECMSFYYPPLLSGKWKSKWIFCGPFKCNLLGTVSAGILLSETWFRRLDWITVFVWAYLDWGVFF